MMCASDIKKYGFTLAEVLITLAIVGIVAAITIPTLISKFQEVQFKAAYKKAYSDFNQVLYQALSNNEMPYRTSMYDVNATTAEFQIMKQSFKIAKECIPSELPECWAPGDTLCGGSCSSGEPDEDGNYVIDMENGSPRLSYSFSFIDASGRSWATYSNSENIYLVDTNGFAGPNQFGMDRWIFTLADSQGNRNNIGIPVKVRPYYYNDVLSKTSFCKHPPCYYKAWLLEK